MRFWTVLTTTVFVLAAAWAMPARADEAGRQAMVAEMFRVMQYDRMLERTWTLLGNQLFDQVLAENPDLNLDAALEAELRAIVRESLDELNPELMAFAGRTIAKYFTEEELEQMLAFYRTDVGRKSIEVMPQMMQEMAAWLPRATERLTKRLAARLNERLRRR